LSGWPSVTDSEVNRKRSLKFKLLPIEGTSIIGLPRGFFSLDKRREKAEPDWPLARIDGTRLCEQTLACGALIHGNCRRLGWAKANSEWGMAGAQGRRAWIERVDGEGSDSIQPRIGDSRPICGSRWAGRLLGFVAAHPSRKNKYPARMGHPGFH